MTIPEQAVEAATERAVNALPLIEELRERTALRYVGDCKCGKCQLVPKELIVRVMNELEWLSRAAQPLMGVQRPEDVAWVEVIECVQLEGFDPNAPAPDSYRVIINDGEAERCFDFDYRVTADLLARTVNAVALPHTGQSQEGDAAIYEKCAQIAERFEPGDVSIKNGQFAADVLRRVQGSIAASIRYRAQVAAPASPQRATIDDLKAVLRRIGPLLSDNAVDRIANDTLERIASPQRAEGESFVKNCFIKARGDETLFASLSTGEIVVRLDNYAVIPMEDYHAIVTAAPAPQAGCAKEGRTAAIDLIDPILQAPMTFDERVEMLRLADDIEGGEINDLDTYQLQIVVSGLRRAAAPPPPVAESGWQEILSALVEWFDKYADQSDDCNYMNGQSEKYPGNGELDIERIAERARAIVAEKREKP